MEQANSADIAIDSGLIARCRELLGDDAQGLSDQEGDLICRHADVIARVIVEMFLERRATPE